MEKRITALLFAITAVTAITITAFSQLAEDRLAHGQTSNETIDVWWPTQGTTLHGTHPFKVLINSKAVESYNMYWQVDNGQWNWMYTDYADWPHKQAWVNVDGWTWSPTGQFTVKFIATDHLNKVIATREVPIVAGPNAGKTLPAPTVQLPPPQPNLPAVSSTATPTLALARTETSLPPKSIAAPVSQPKNSLYVSPHSQAQKAADALATSKPEESRQLRIIADQAGAVWFGGWNKDVEAEARTLTETAAKAGSIPVIVAYNIPQRDCGGYSAGGTSDYENWIQSLARGIGSNSAMVVLEPDALAGMNCLSGPDQTHRLNLLKFATSALKQNSKTSVYIDAGHPHWLPAEEIAKRLNLVDISKADGFSLNVSNFYPTDEVGAYGKKISSLTSGKHFIIDTSRNGNGANGEWCNPAGRALGNPPTLHTNDDKIDGYLWIKAPGESDGECRGAPAAGVFWNSYALELVRNKHW